MRYGLKRLENQAGCILITDCNHGRNVFVSKHFPGCVILETPPPLPPTTHTPENALHFLSLKKKYRSKLLCYKLQDCKGLMSLLSPQRGGDNRADSSSISLLKKFLMHLNIWSCFWRNVEVINFCCWSRSRFNYFWKNSSIERALKISWIERRESGRNHFDIPEETVTLQPGSVWMQGGNLQPDADCSSLCINGANRHKIDCNKWW